MSHTPGPWILKDGYCLEPATPQRIVATIAHLDHGCRVWRASDTEPYTITEMQRETDANKRLITASPVMLDALKAAESFLAGFEDRDNPDDVPAALAQVRAAIKDAEGNA